MEFFFWALCLMKNTEKNQAYLLKIATMGNELELVSLRILGAMIPEGSGMSLIKLVLWRRRSPRMKGQM